MQRGSQILFNDFLPAPVIPIDRKKGRSDELLQQRNELMLHRYHYHRTKDFNGKRISYESLIETVSAEFFLSNDRVIDLMIDLHNRLTHLNIQWPMDKNAQFAKHCEKKWPFLVWG